MKLAQRLVPPPHAAHSPRRLHPVKSGLEDHVQPEVSKSLLMLTIAIAMRSMQSLLPLRLYKKSI
jgi:hypothetical protein